MSTTVEAEPLTPQHPSWFSSSINCVSHVSGPVTRVRGMKGLSQRLHASWPIQKPFSVISADDDTHPSKCMGDSFFLQLHPLASVTAVKLSFVCAGMLISAFRVWHGAKVLTRRLSSAERIGLG